MPAVIVLPVWPPIGLAQRIASLDPGELLPNHVAVPHHR
jgi:hypothetical protein